VGAGRNFDGTVRSRYREKAKADNQHVWGQPEVWGLLKERALIVNVKLLVLRAPKRHIAAPLVGHYSAVHGTTDDIENLRVKKELRSKARWLERHRQKVTMSASVWFVFVVLEVCKENRPKRFSTSIDHVFRQMCPEHAVSLRVYFENFFVRDHPSSRSDQSDKRWRLQQQPESGRDEGYGPVRALLPRTSQQSGTD
jgi:hypothetical protein